MWKFIKQPSPLAALLMLTTLLQPSFTQTTCNNGQGRVLYERLPNQQLQGFDDDVIRDTAPPFRVLEKCQDLCLRDRTASNNLVRACTSFDFQPGSRIASYNGNTEYEESTCYLTREQAVPEGIGNLMLVPNSVHFTEVCLSSNRPERECPSRRYVFERYPRKKLKLPVSDIKEITAANRSDCEDKCLSEFSFVCRSANFDSTLRSCTLSRFTRRTHPELLEDDPNADYLENTCLNAERRCDGLVVFVKEENKKLGGPFEVDIFNNMTLEECQSMCLRAEKYICRSVEFDDKTKQCILSEEDSISQKDDLSISSSPTHHFYDLVCLDNQRGSEYPDNSVTSHLFGGTSGRRPDTAFQRYRNSRLGGEFHSEITGRSLSECLDECLRQTSFQCRSAVYSDRFRTCRLSRFNQRDKMRIVYDEDYDYYENLMLGSDDPMGSTRPEMNWHTTHSGDRGEGNYPDDRFPSQGGGTGGGAGSRYPSSMPGRYPYERPGMYPDYGDSRYPTSAMPDRYPGGGGDRRPSTYPYDPYGMPPQRMPGADRYPPPPGSVDPYYQMTADRYPMMGGGDRYPMMQGGYPGMPDRYPAMQGAGDRYPMMGGADRYPMQGNDRYPPPGSDRYPPPGAGGDGRYPPPGGDNRYPPMPPAGYYPRPGVGDPLDSKYPPPPEVSNRFPGDNRDPYGNKDRYNPDDRSPNLPPMYPDMRNPPNRGQPIDRPQYGGDQGYNVRYPESPDPKYGLYGPMRPYPMSENRFPVGTDRFPLNIYKYGNRGRVPPYPGQGGMMGYGPADTGDRGYGQQRPRPPYAVMVGFGPQDLDNSISDTYGMPYGPPGIGSRPPISAGTRCDEVDSYKQMGLRQKMRKQFVRRAVRVPTLVHCQRECTSARDFICRSFNFKDDGSGDRQPAQPTGDTFNCELSDRDTRELDINNPQMFETGSYDFYERSISGRSNDGECLDVSQVCNEDGMEFTLRTNEPFTGRVYSYGFYDRCFFRGNGGTVNVLRISGPQGYPECGTQRYGDTMTNIIVVQFSESLQTSRDKRFNLTCLFRGPGEAVVTSGYIGAGSGSPIPIEYLPAENSMSSKVRLMILYQGRPTTTIAVGDPLTFRLESQDGYNHINDIFATNVVARDPYSGRSVQLIDRYGCPVDTFVFPELGRSREGESLEARFNAFKIPESNFLVFEATVRTCREGCQPAYCNGVAGRSETSFGRRKRSLNDTDIVETDSQVISSSSEEDLIKQNETTVSNVKSNDDDNKDDFPEQVREMIEVFESREEMQQESIAKKMISVDTESVCLSVTEYYGLIVSTMLLLVLLMSVAVIIGLLYRKYWKVIIKNSSFDYHSNSNNSFTNHTASRDNSAKIYGTNSKSSKVNNEDFNEAYRSTSTVSLFGSGLQKTFATGNLSRICQIPVINPINKSNGSYDDSEPIYTDPSLFERSRI